MVCPSHATYLQWHDCESFGVPATDDPGIGPGWQQSKQNWEQSAVVRTQIRVVRDDPPKTDATASSLLILLQPIGHSTQPFPSAHVRFSRHRLHNTQSVSIADPTPQRRKNTKREKPSVFVPETVHQSRLSILHLCFCTFGFLISLLSALLRRCW